MHVSLQQETYCNLTSIADINNNLQSLADVVDENNRTYIDPVANRMRSAFQPWLEWGLETADNWFVKPFDYRRKAEHTTVTQEEEEDGRVVSATAVIVEESKKEDIDAGVNMSGIDMNTISTSIDVTGDRNDSAPSMKSAEI